MTLNMPRIKEAARESGIVLLAFAGMFGVLSQCNCSATERRASDALTVAEYERALDVCREAGRADGGYLVYHACADDVDRRFCAERGLRCSRDGGAP